MRDLAKATSQALSPDSALRQNAFDRAQYLEAARMLLGCYRSGDANDPEVYTSAVVRVLSVYPLDVVYQVVDPVGGLPGKLKWLPTIPEIKDACEAIDGFNRRMRERDERIERQLAEREDEEERRTRPSYEELQRRCAAGGLYIGGKKQVQFYDRQKGLEELKSKYGVTDEQLSNIPNLPERVD